MFARLLALVMLAVPALAFGNDAFAEKGVGGLTIGKTNKISMETEKLFLSVDKVEVEYEFLNVSEKDENVTIAFPLPRVAICDEQSQAGGHCHDESVLALEFETWIDGTRMAPTKNVERVLVGDREVSALLRKHGLTKVQDSQKLEKLAPGARAELEKAGLLSWDQKRLVMNWELEKVFYWEQPFKKGQRLKVRHQYKPISGGAQGAPNEPRFCIDATTKAGIPRREKQVRPASGGPAFYRWTNYILKSATSWAGPIKSFELTIEKHDSAAIVSTCFKGLEKKDDRTFVARLQNFVPTEDITVLFF